LGSKVSSWLGPPTIISKITEPDEPRATAPRLDPASPSPRAPAPLARRKSRRVGPDPMIAVEPIAMLLPFLKIHGRGLAHDLIFGGPSSPYKISMAGILERWPSQAGSRSQARARSSSIRARRKPPTRFATSAAKAISSCSVERTSREMRVRDQAPVINPLTT
jgi:hypothetical protein